MEPAIKYRLIKKDKHTGARMGELITPHGTFPTPMFMPVGTQATVKSIAPDELDAMCWRYFGKYLSFVVTARRTNS